MALLKTRQSIRSSANRSSPLRRGNAHSARGVSWFLRETRTRLPAGVPLKLRAARGFYRKAVVKWCEAEELTFPLTADQTAPLLQALSTLPARSWRPLPGHELAAVAELRYQPVGWAKPSRYLIKREVAETSTGDLYWQYHALVTNDAVRPAAAVMSWHLQHADRENAIKEHKSGFGLEQLPTQKFHATWAYLLRGQSTFNLVAWFKRLVLPPSYQRATIKTIRHQLLNLAGKIVHTARQCFLVLSNCSRYQSVWQFAIKRLATVQFT